MTVVPAYFHPAVAGADWARLARAGTGLRAVVLNVDSGPGTVREGELAAVAETVRATGVAMLGYVDTAYGRRRSGDLGDELRRYSQWYGVDGFFLDQAATAPSLLPWYGALTADAGRYGTVVLNHGAHPDAGYADIADALVTFEGPAAAHAAVRPPAWALTRPAGSLWHLVYATPAGRVPAVLRHAAACNAGTVYVTDRDGANPWDGVPDYFEDLLVERAMT